MTTRIEKFSRESAAEAAELLANRRVVAIPTETVYGLAANALDKDMWGVKEIFRVKGRPQDNPLIVHISSMKMLEPLVTEIPDIAVRLAERFWGGPLTMIFPKSDLVSDVI
ncbi:MAG: Sua5/YciO/YrdC/YwlC family protein, partial [Oscillospiraceae bacterium]|nr:Sua5/YciO/YrdC/YwlC family protein [Oscillospiraceae bacterium]